MRLGGVRLLAWSPVFVVWLFAVAAGLFVLHASYPGYLNPDSFIQLSQIFSGKWGDWYPPFVALVWSGLLKVLPGPVGFIVLDNILIWGALALIAAVITRVVGWSGLSLLVVPLLPGLFNFLGHAHRDAMLAGWMLAAFACSLMGNREAASLRLLWQLLANLFALAAFLTRPNAIFATIPLLFYANRRFCWRKNLLVAVLMLCLMPAVQTLQSRLLDVRSQSPSDSVKTFHLLALSYFEGRNLFPGQWTEDDSRAIVQDCYSPVQWDTVWRWGQCADLILALERQQLWGGTAMTRSWLDGLISSPLSAWSAMVATFQLSMHHPNSPTMLYAPPKSDLVNWEVAQPFRWSTGLARGYIESGFNLSLSKPWVFAVVLAFGIALLLVLRLDRTWLGSLALAVQASGAVFLLSYLPVNVSAEYRYFYWSGFAAWLGVLLVLMAWLAQCHSTSQEEEKALPPALFTLLRLMLCLLPALMLALVFGGGRLPLETRIVQLTPLDDGVVAVSRLGAASTPRWMERHEGQIEAPGWHWHQGELRSEPGAGILTTRMKVLHQTVRLQLSSGPDGGSVRVQDGPFVRIVETRAAEAGEIKLDLPPYGKLADHSRRLSWHQPARVILVSLLLCGLLLHLSRTRKGSITESL